MKNFLRNFDPMYAVIICFFSFLGFVFYLEYSLETGRTAFSEACIAMGGTPLIGKDETRACFKSDAVLSVN